MSILDDTKKMLGIEADYDVFDLEIMNHINASLSKLSQIGVGDATPITDNSRDWDDLDLVDPQLNWAKTLIFSETKMAFDPPTTSYMIDALKNQIEEQTWRLSTLVEADRVLPEV